MGRGSSKTSTKVLPLIPLAPPLAVLPNTTLKIPITNRSDVAAILAKIYSVSPTARPDASITVACVPLNSSTVSPDGQLLIDDARRGDKTMYESDPIRASKKDIFGWACVAKVSGVQGRKQGDLCLVVEGLERVQVVDVVQERPYFEGELVAADEYVDIASSDLLNQFNLLKQLSRELLALVRLSAILPRTPQVTLSPIVARRLETFITRKDLSEAGALADFMANVVDCTHEETLRVLAAVDVKERVDRVIEILQRQINNIQGNTRMTITTTQAPTTSLDMDTLRRLQQEVLTRRGKTGGGLPAGFPGGFPGGGQQQAGEEEPNEIEELKKRLEDAKLSPDANKVAQRELSRLQKMNPAQAEYQVCRNYLENLAEIPWSKTTVDQLDANTLVRAKEQLDHDHFGLEKVKKRLLEYLAVLKLKEQANRGIDDQIRALTETGEAKEKEQAPEEKVAKEPTEAEMRLLEKKRMVDKSPILLLVGPPGVGKTSLAKSVATALGRKFHRISLGGVRDEAEIRGHRRTYVAAMPGLIVNGLKKVGVANPVFLLDEIDKLGMMNHNGDPGAAMLEVLDPEQNHTFTDHYVNIPIDLSKVLFIATANSLDTIPPPLLDRMETIQLSGYTTLEKRHIAARHLIPKQITTNGLHQENINIPTDVLDKIITSYTRESGVRNLEREIGSVCRSKAVEYATAKDTNTLAAYTPTVTLEDLDATLGIEKFAEELTEQSSRPGVITGLVAYSTGGQGSILFIEIADMPGTGRVQLTGKLGDVLKESVEVALTWVKAHAFDLGLCATHDEDIMKNRSIHVHCPSGAIPKDGPSAGLAHTIGLISLFSNQPVPPTLAMTGEISLRGRVLPVGGIKEKLIGALGAGVERVLLPEGNRKDARELPREVTEGIKIEFVGHIWEALGRVWPERWEGREGGWESRL
ncbi:peroxisomal [Pyrenophora tritici-repentis]|uniref:Lon protease homolog 2, peroxisomal n=2 Tax=Pyrenophora tritici-repentis TaxID=45151 RepID=A0A922N309_9PLEO|nr:ATP-dependent protease La [Pyrenophora tritici-repentis Pt-1C-BFP]EDU42252.1 ATP-dependent protease La [Pyrenophora tritici-repentis Pt-1C-BFP]KAI1508132.1 peroxisomal [Pyrenophora tritici-repentis]KAI1665160.1 peroxisomal [Pyrenophora tritici-repentis]KAI1690279.1 peroxisomal [Pyrenophora tritici-repentis]